MFYSFRGDKPLGFMCGSFHQFKRGVSSFKWGVTTHLMRGRKWHLFWLAHPIEDCSPSPLIYICVLCCSSITCSSSCSLSLFPLLHRKRHGLGEVLQKYFLHHHHQVVVLLEFPVDPLLPLPRWNEGSEVVVKPHV